MFILSMKRKSFVLRKCNKKMTCLLNRKENKAVTTCFSKNIYIQSMKKNILIQSREKKLILQKFFLLCIVSCRSLSSSPSPSPSTSLTDFLYVAIYYSWSWLGQSSILSLSSTSCIIYCIISHIIFYGFLNKEAPTFKSINNKK